LELRASDVERESVVERLKEHRAEGRLTLDELAVDRARAEVVGTALRGLAPPLTRFGYERRSNPAVRGSPRTGRGRSASAERSRSSAQPATARRVSDALGTMTKGDQCAGG
jgi:hypothetical protein